MDGIDKFMLENPADDDANLPTTALIDAAKKDIEELSAQDSLPFVSPLPTKRMKLALLLLRRYDKEMKEEDLDESIESMEKGIELAVIDRNPRLSETVSGWALRRILDLWKKRKASREQEESPGEMETRVYKAVKWADSLPNGDFGSDTGWRKLLADELVELSSRLKARDEGEKHDPSAAIEHLRKAVAVLRSGCLNASSRKSVEDLSKKLSDELMKRYDLTKDESDLDEAIKWTTEALELLGPASPGRSTETKKLLINGWWKLSDRLMARYHLKKDASDLEEAIDLAKAAIDVPHVITPDQSAKTKKPSQMVRLSDRLMVRYDLKKDPNDLDDAIRWIREAFEVMDSHDPDPSFEVGERRIAMSEKLNHYLTLRYNSKKDPNDLDEAIDLAKAAIDVPHVITPDHSVKTQMVWLSEGLIARYNLKKDPNDLDEAIKWIREASEAHSHDLDPSFDVGELQTAISAKLSNYLMARYELTKDPDDLDEAIKWIREPFEATDGQKINLLIGLSHRLVRQYQRDDRLEILNEAITLTSRIIATTDLSAKIGQHDTYFQFWTISIRLGERFHRKKDPEDLNRAIGFLEKTVKAMKSDNTDPSSSTGKLYTIMLEKLSDYLMLRYELEKDASDLDEAINFIKSVLNVPQVVTPSQSVKTKMPSQMLRLTDRLVARYDLKKDASDRDKAIELTDAFFKVLDSTSQGQSSEEVMEMCKCMWKMRRNCLQERYEVNPRREDLDEAIKAEEQLIALAVCDGMDIPVESNILDGLLQERDELRKREVSDSNAG